MSAGGEALSGASQGAEFRFIIAFADDLSVLGGPGKGHGRGNGQHQGEDEGDETHFDDIRDF